jgi:hypothetical protein
LERALVMDELARVEKVEVDNESLEAEFNNAWATLAMTDEDFAKRTKNGTKPSRELVDAVAMDSAQRLLTRRVLERIKTIANSEAVEVVEAKPKAKKTKKAAVEEPETTPVEAAEPVKKKAAKKKAE